MCFHGNRLNPFSPPILVSRHVEHLLGCLSLAASCSCFASSRQLQRCIIGFGLMVLIVYALPNQVPSLFRASGTRDDVGSCGVQVLFGSRDMSSFSSQLNSLATEWGSTLNETINIVVTCVAVGFFDYAFWTYVGLPQHLDCFF